MALLADQLAEKIHHLSPTQLMEVNHFIDALERSAVGDVKSGEWLTMSASTLDRIWSNPEDSVYDDL